MASFNFSTNWPSFQQPYHQYTTAVFPPPPELTSFHDHNFTFSDTFINPFSFESNHHFSSSFSNGVSFHNHSPVTYPTLSSSSNPLLTAQQPVLRIPSPDLFTQFYDPYPYDQLIPNVCPMEEHTLMVPNPNFQGEERKSTVEHVRKESGDGGRRLSAQSLAARVRRRKISEKTLELGKLVPGGHRLNTAEMFQAAFKYVKFLQAQVNILQLMGSSPEPSEELHHALVTSRSVQEKLYGAEKCIVTRTFGESLAVDHQGIKDE